MPRRLALTSVVVALALQPYAAVVLAAEAARAPDRESIRASAFEAAAAQTADEHFVVRHPPELRPEAVFALRSLGEGRALIRSGLGLPADGTITVLLLPPAVFRAGTGNPRWVRGAYDGRILLPVAGCTTEADVAELRSVLVHELTHALLRRVIATVLPPWFEEGLAGKYDGTTALASADWLRRRRAPRFSGLDGIDDAIRAGGWREDAGRQGARLAVEALDELGGPGAAVGIIASCRSGASFASALAVAVPGGRSALENLLRRLQSSGFAE